jgi:hypothetical protein
VAALAADTGKADTIANTGSTGTVAQTVGAA